MLFILRQVSKTNGIEIQRKPGMMPGFRFSKKVRPQKEETPWLLTSPVSFSPALHIGQLWEEQLT